MINQINTHQSVSDHGEVFTSEREVKAMLDLVKDQTERIINNVFLIILYDFRISSRMFQ